MMRRERALSLISALLPLKVSDSCWCFVLFINPDLFSSLTMRVSPGAAVERSDRQPSGGGRLGTVSRATELRGPALKNNTSYRTF